MFSKNADPLYFAGRRKDTFKRMNIKNVCQEDKTAFKGILASPGDKLSGPLLWEHYESFLNMIKEAKITLFSKDDSDQFNDWTDPKLNTRVHYVFKFG